MTRSGAAGMLPAQRHGQVTQLPYWITWTLALGDIGSR